MFNTILFNPIFTVNYLISISVLFSIYTYIKQNIKYNAFNTNGDFFLEYQYINYMIYISMIFTLIIILFIQRRLLLRNHNVIMVFTIFTIVLFYLVFSQSYITFFLTYELLLLLTTIVVNLISPNIRSRIITLYFVI